MLLCENLCVNYGKKQVLSEVSLNIGNGLTCILGQNGTGKSTLIKAISGQVLFKGNVFLNGVDVNGMSIDQKSKAIVFMTQSYEVSFNFTVAEILKMGFHGIGFDEDVYQKAMQVTHILHIENRTYNTLSGGEKQRVQFARSFSRLKKANAQLLILDEPSSSADIKQEMNMINLAKQASKEKPVIMISHNIALARKYADNIILLKDGTLQKHASIITDDDIKTCFELNEEFVL